MEHNNGLKSCPHCGGAAWLNASYDCMSRGYLVFVECDICGTRGKPYLALGDPGDVDLNAHPYMDAAQAEPETVEENEEIAVEEPAEEETAAEEPGAVLNGWVTEGGKTYYYTNGKKASGIKTIDGKKYVFGLENNKLYKNSFATIGAKKVYANGSGVLTTGWKTIGGKKYYFKPNGAMAKSIVTINGKK